MNLLVGGIRQAETRGTVEEKTTRLRSAEGRRTYVVDVPSDHFFPLEDLPDTVRSSRLR